MKRIFMKSIGLCLIFIRLSSFGQVVENFQNKHVLELAKANKAVERWISLAESDSLRPIYHVTAASRLIGDPNGPIYFAGEYHVFFQYFPFWGDSTSFRPVWGHAVSPDMVHWRHLPIALAPTPGSYDDAGIASGCCVIDKGVPTIIYTGVSPQSQCLAISDDTMRTWRKDLANPVIPSPPAVDSLSEGFRDPFAWKEGDKWRLLVGSALRGQGGTVLLYQSNDLHNWEFIGPLCVGMGKHCIQWECPNFFPLKERHILIVSPLFSDVSGLRGMVEYAVGNYHDNKFEYDHWYPVDLGGPTSYYAPNSFEDTQGRRILWGFIMTDRSPKAGWCNSLSLPRVVTLASDGSLNFNPIPELTALRYDERSHNNLKVEPNRELIMEKKFGMHYEVMIEVDLDKASQFELRIGRSNDGDRFIPLKYNVKTGRLVFGDKEADFRLNPNEKTLSIRLFVDGSVGEAYFNERVCFSNNLSLSLNSSGISVMAEGGKARIKKISLWKMNSIWPNKEIQTH